MAASINTYTRFDRSSDLQQVIYVLKKIKERKSTAKELAAELLTEEQVIRRFLRFIQNVSWIKEENRQLWVITEKGDTWLSEIECVMPPA